MNMQQIRSMASDLGIKSGNMNKARLIKIIQQREGSFDCFATASLGECDQKDCIWRKDCFAAAVKLSH